MRSMIGVVLLLIFFGGCSGSHQLADPFEQRDNGFTDDAPQSENKAYLPDCITDNRKQQKPIDSTNIFTTTMRIHEDMPEFTFRRIVEDYDPDIYYPEMYLYIPFFPRRVTIIIEDECGNIIQSISDLTQDEGIMSGFDSADIQFDDLNFDGFLDMRLLRWQHGAGNLSSLEYFWLWDAEVSRFILSEQLAEIGFATSLVTNQETRQIRVFHRWSRLYEFYEYHDGEFMLVAYEYELFKQDD